MRGKLGIGTERVLEHSDCGHVRHSSAVSFRVCRVSPAGASSLSG
jgi:hypothetical protein